MKKILFIIYTHSMGGGAEKILVNTVNGLARKTDYDISVLEYAEYGIKKESFDSRINVLKPIVDMNASSRIERIAKYFMVHFCPGLLRKLYIKEKYDVEIAFNYQIPSFLSSSRKDVYNIQWNHGDIYELEKKPFKKFLQGISFKKANKIVAISKNTEKSILDLFPQFSKKVCTIYNGTDVNYINSAANELSDISLQRNSLIFLGRLEPQKGPLKLIQYTQRLISEGIDVKLYLLGTGIQEKEIKEYVENANLEESVKLLGYITKPYSLIKQSSVVCMLSESEGFPTVFVEGMALGKPFISTPVGGTEELSAAGSCGVIINNYDEFRKAVLDVVFDTGIREKMSAACLEHIKLFSLDKQINRVIELIEEN